MLRHNSAVEKIKEVEVETEAYGPVTAWILKISSALGSFSGFGFTIPGLLIEGGGYSSEEMTIAAIKLFLSALLGLLAVLA